MIVAREEVDIRSVMKDKENKNYKIILADDHEIVRDITAEMLECLGHQVITFDNGQQVLDYYVYGDQDVDLFILDLVMPKMGGVDCLKKLIEINPNLKFVICSGYPNHQDLSVVIKHGIKSFLPKPYQLADLRKVIDSLEIDTIH